MVVCLMMVSVSIISSIVINWNSPVRKICPFILLICLYPYGLMDILLQHYHPVLLLLFILQLKLSQIWPSRALPSTYLCLFEMLLSFFEPPLFFVLTPRDTIGSSHIFPVPALESTISLRNPDFFYWRIYLKTKI